MELYDWFPKSTSNRVIFFLKLPVLLLYFAGQVAPVIWVLSNTFGVGYLGFSLFSVLASTVGLTTTYYFGRIFLFPQLQTTDKPPLNLWPVITAIYNDIFDAKQKHSIGEKIKRCFIAVTLGFIIIGPRQCNYKRIITFN